MNSKYIILFSLLFASASAAAQDMSDVWKQTIGILKEKAFRKKNLDSGYALQPDLRWTASVGLTGLRMGADLRSDIQLTDYLESGTRVVNATLETGMERHLYKKLNFGLSYGDLGLSMGFEVGKLSPRRNSYFNFGTAGSYYGLRFQYYKTHENLEGMLRFEGDEYPPIKLTSKDPCQLRDLTIDAFYAFNRRKFVYTASHGGRIVQRRSVGSWMVAAKYLQGDFALNDDVQASLLNELNRYSTKQFLLGAGYSYNWVVLHRDPENWKTWKGLQNLTVNVTALPVLSLFNDLYVDKGTGVAKTRTHYAGQPAFSPTLRAGICYAWDRFYITVQAGYNRFGFHGADTLTESLVKTDSGEQYRQRRKVSTRGVFFDLTSNVQLNVRF
ncbi:MAG: DUF4421 family protein [Bacteroidales bacterium]|jgi:hypothetical protein|nr:DUF4421 family protein [Bacteroidales bacterium]